MTSFHLNVFKKSMGYGTMDHQQVLCEKQLMVTLVVMYGYIGHRAIQYGNRPYSQTCPCQLSCRTELFPLACSWLIFFQTIPIHDKQYSHSRNLLGSPRLRPDEEPGSRMCSDLYLAIRRCPSQESLHACSELASHTIAKQITGQICHASFHLSG